MNNKTGKTLVSFNVKNGAYSIGGATPSVKSLNYLVKFSKEKNLSTKAIYGDGEMIVALVNDKGFTGNVTFTAQDYEYNKDLGIGMDIDGGYAEIQQIQSIDHDIYFETNVIIDGKLQTAKVWNFNINASAPSESLDQNTEDSTINNTDYSLTFKGVYLKASTGTADYVDKNGNKIKVFSYKKLPSDVGYDTFGDTVPVPKAKV